MDNKDKLYKHQLIIIGSKQIIIILFCLNNKFITSSFRQTQYRHRAYNIKEHYINMYCNPIYPCVVFPAIYVFWHEFRGSHYTMSQYDVYVFAASFDKLLSIQPHSRFGIACLTSAHYDSMTTQGLTDRFLRASDPLGQ